MRRDDAETIITEPPIGHVPAPTRTRGSKRKIAPITADPDKEASYGIQPTIEYVEVSEEGRLTRSKRRSLLAKTAGKERAKSTAVAVVKKDDVEDSGKGESISRITSPHFPAAATNGKLLKKRKTVTT